MDNIKITNEFRVKLIDEMLNIINSSSVLHSGLCNLKRTAFYSLHLESKN